MWTGLFSEDDYRGQKQTLEMELESLVVPEVDAAAEAGDLLKRLPDLWEGASLEERHELAVRILDDVYVDLKDSRSIVGIKPKPPFPDIFRITTAREGSGISFLTDQPPAFRPEAESVSCSWWRRGRVELPVQLGFRFDVYKLSRRFIVSPLISLSVRLLQRPADDLRSAPIGVRRTAPQVSVAAIGPLGGRIVATWPFLGGHSELFLAV